MPAKPGDNKLGVRDTRTLEAYRDKIDPEGWGVKKSGARHSTKPSHCTVCGAEAIGPRPRLFALKRGWPYRDLRYVCNSCCEKAQAP